MAWLKSTLLAAAALASTALTSPLQGRVDGVQLYRFLVETDDTPPSISGYLGYNSAIGAGLYKDPNVVTVYGIPSLNSSKAIELHTYPIGIVDHVLALEGSRGFLSIYDEVNIGDKVVSSSNQTVVDAKNFQVKDGLLNYLGDRSGSWVVFPQGPGYVLRWLGAVPTIEDYLPSHVKVVPVGDGSSGR